MQTYLYLRKWNVLRGVCALKISIGTSTLTRVLIKKIADAIVMVNLTHPITQFGLYAKNAIAKMENGTTVLMFQAATKLRNL